MNVWGGECLGGERLTIGLTRLKPLRMLVIVDFDYIDMAADHNWINIQKMTISSPAGPAKNAIEQVGGRSWSRGGSSLLLLSPSYP